MSLCFSVTLTRPFGYLPLARPPQTPITFSNGSLDPPTVFGYFHGCIVDAGRNGQQLFHMLKVMAPLIRHIRHGDMSPKGEGMNKVECIGAEHLSLRKHPFLTEKREQERIAEDPGILGLGELELRDVERPQPAAGRLDLLLRDPDTSKRYEVELMLGALDESHIIRTLEYWDIERKRYPQYDHCAVIVAEDITSRFLNVLGLFNSAVPIIALQMSAYQLGEGVMLTFTKVLDETVLGLEEDDDEGEATDRQYWEKRVPKKTLDATDAGFALVKSVVPNAEQTYKKQYMGLSINGRSNSFVHFRPRKHYIRIGVRISDRDTWREKFEDLGVTVLEVGAKFGRLIMNLYPEDVQKHMVALTELIQAAYAEQGE